MVFRTYVKILGPPIIGPLRELEKIAIKKNDVCIMDFALANQLSQVQVDDVGASRSSPSANQWVHSSIR